MIIFFKTKDQSIIAVDSDIELNTTELGTLSWACSNAVYLKEDTINASFVGPRKEMITPWSTNAVEIVKNMGLGSIKRMEIFHPYHNGTYDPMLQQVYNNLDQEIFTIDHIPEEILEIEDIAAYNKQEGLALNADEIGYLKNLSQKLGRKLTDSEIFGFSQVNSEHCRHKIFNGQFIIDGIKKEKSLFDLIKSTTKINKNKVSSAYKDNCAFLEGPTVKQFVPTDPVNPSYFKVEDIKSVISLKAETHNFPTTVEPFNGAATGSGGEIRDRIAGGKAAYPLAGTAVYMTSYPRLFKDRKWENTIPPRNWLYQSPDQILVKASNGASDFGNKFGQPLICGSVLTFEHIENKKQYGYDKVIMLAGGIGYGSQKDSEKGVPQTGDKIILIGGDNYRIGMGGGAVSSVATGEYNNKIELNAVQRSNPEMQKRAYNAIRALAESSSNPIISIHDHGAGGHLNCLSELVEETGCKIDLDQLPKGDPTLSAKELVGNESQERMGLILKNEDVGILKEICKRERAPMYVIGECTGDGQFTFYDSKGNKPIDLQLEDMFGNPPKTIMEDSDKPIEFTEVTYRKEKVQEYIENILQIEAVACKDWLTNKVDRSVTGKVAKQQTTGEIQLPLNNLGVSALDFHSAKGIATSIGHAPVSGLIDPEAGSVLSIAEALTNIVWAPLEDGIKSISLSANWMWPCKNKGEDSRLYKAVEAASNFAIQLGINIPTGKDSLSMTQKYPEGDKVYSPGTVIISATAEVNNINKIIEPTIQDIENSSLYYLPFSNDELSLGGSSFAQINNQVGNKAHSISDSSYFVKVFDTVQQLIKQDVIIAGHDISSGGIITTILEMCFGSKNMGAYVHIDPISKDDIIVKLFNERPGVIIQVRKDKNIEAVATKRNIKVYNIGKINNKRELSVNNNDMKLLLDIDMLRDKWYKTSYLLDNKQTSKGLAKKRYENYKNQALSYIFPKRFTGKYSDYSITPERTVPTGIKSAVIREKGINGEREMAHSMHLAGFDVKDIHMTDLVSGKETLDDIHFIVFTGGFSNSDVLGSAKGWSGVFLFNEKARKTLNRFYERNDTLSLGVCNGCQLMMELDLIAGHTQQKPYMGHNNSQKFESSFINVDIPQSQSIMLKSLQGSKLGVWIAHGEGKFNLPKEEKHYNIALKYAYGDYPGNPNGSDYNVAGLCSKDGRHLAMMPHLERSIFPWNWPHYPSDYKGNNVSPWIEAFINAKNWIKEKQ